MTIPPATIEARMLGHRRLPSEPPKRPLPQRPTDQMQRSSTFDVKAMSGAISQQPEAFVTNLEQQQQPGSLRKAFGMRSRALSDQTNPRGLDRIAHVPSSRPFQAAVAPPANAGHNRNRSLTFAAQAAEDEVTTRKRSRSRTEKLLQVMTRPEVIFRTDNSGPLPNSRFNPDPNGRIVRTFFSSSVDQAPIPEEEPEPEVEHDLPIFDESLISTKIASEIPDGYTIRPLKRGDYRRGYMDVMRVLGKAGMVSRSDWDTRVDWLQGQADNYYVIVIENETGTVIGTGMLIMQRRFLSNLSKVGNIEDIAVARSEKGKKIGLRILEALIHVSEQLECSRSVIHCSEANELFHAQCNFVKDGSTMMVLAAPKKVVPGTNAPALPPLPPLPAVAQI